jgi:hypothetical protein
MAGEQLSSESGVMIAWQLSFSLVRGPFSSSRYDWRRRVGSARRSPRRRLVECWCDGVDAVSKEGIAEGLVGERHPPPAVDRLAAGLRQAAKLFAVGNDPREVSRGTPPWGGLGAHVAEATNSASTW